MPSDITQNNKTIAKNTIFLSIRMVFTLLVALYTTRVVLNQLGIEDYGIYNVVCGFVSMFSFLTTSMANGIQRFYNFELGKSGHEGANHVYNSAIFIQVGLCVILVILAETIGLWYMNNKMVIHESRFDIALVIYQLSIVSSVLSIMQVPYLAAVMAHEKMDFYSLVSICDVILKLLIVISLKFCPSDKLLNYGILMTFVPLADLIIYVIYTKNKFPDEIQIRKENYNSLLKSMLSFSGWNIFGRLGDVLREQGINVLLNSFFGTAINAARGVAYQVISGLQGLVTNINIAIRPQIVQSYASQNYSRMLHLMYSMSKLSFLFLYIIALPVMIEIHYILELWLGNNVPEYTSIFVILSIIVSFINLLNAAVSAIVHATGKMALYQTTTTTAIIMILPISYIFLKLGCSPVIPFWIGIFFAIIMQVVSLYILKKLVPFSILDYHKKVILPLIYVISCTILFPMIPFYLLPEGFLRLVLVTITSIVVGTVITYFLALDTSERKIINSFIKHK